MVEPIRRPVHSRPPSFGARFLIYQRNIENLSKDRAALGQEIRKSVAEPLGVALESRAAIAIKGASLDVRSAGELAVARSALPGRCRVLGHQDRMNPLKALAPAKREFRAVLPCRRNRCLIGAPLRKQGQ
jgi:hypothetical protein